MQETQEMRVRFLGWVDPREEGMATHSSILAVGNPMDRGTWWVNHPMGSQRVRHNKESDTTLMLTQTNSCEVREGE